MRPKSTRVLFLVLLAAITGTPGDTAAQEGPVPPAPPQYAYPYLGLESHVRLAFTPREATVYVDGYFAGRVDDYDGTFQRLHVEAGPHEIVIYLKGYRSTSEKLYLSPNATRKLSGKLEPLGPGEPDEPLPVPLSPPPAPPDEPVPAPNGPAV